MTLISITDESAGLLPYVRYVLDAMAFHRGDARSVEQVKALLAIEHKSWIEQGPENFEPSPISQAVLSLSERRAGSVYVTGLVGLAMVGLKSVGRLPSVEQAIELTTNYVTQAHKTDFEVYDFESRSYKTVGKSVASSERAVRRSYSEHKSAIHICAARQTANDYLEPLAPFDSAPEADEAYLATAIAFQKFFSEHDHKGRDARSAPFELLHIGWNSGFHCSAGPLFPTEHLMVGLLGEFAIEFDPDR